jgi:hypothetical protein
MKPSVYVKECLSILKSGILPGIILFAALYLLYGVLRSVFAIGFEVFHFSSHLVNCVLIVIAFLAYIYIVALLLKSFYLKLLKNKYPEVIFQTGSDSGIWLRGFVTGRLHEESINRDLYKVVYAAHFNPFCFTIEIESEKVYFTGKNAMENVMFNFSGGLYKDHKNKPLE